MALLAHGCGGAVRPATPPVAPPVLRPQPVPPATPAAGLPAVVVVSSPAGVRTVPLEDYVAGVIAGELAVGALEPEVAPRMLLVQAVVARTWAVANLGRHAREGFDFCSTTHCQVVRDAREILAANRPLVERAASASAGVLLVAGGRPIDAVFHADCGGATSGAESVWGGQGLPYLRAVVDDACRLNPASAWSYSLTREQVRVAVNATDRSAVGARLHDVRVLQRDDSGRATLVALDGERSPLLRGEELRAVLSRQFGPRAIRSPRFDVTRAGDTFTFVGRGFGHGVGLCQRGALARLRAGATPEAVLQAYYAGARLQPAAMARAPEGPGAPRAGLLSR